MVFSFSAQGHLTGVKFECAAHLRNHLAMDVPGAVCCVGLDKHLKINEISI
jgi:hypothetical protein